MLVLVVLQNGLDRPTSAVSAVGDDNIRCSLSGSNILVIRGLDEGLVLLNDTLNVSPTICDISSHCSASDQVSNGRKGRLASARQANVRVCIHKDLEVHQIKQTAIVECQNPFKEDHISSVHQST